MIGNTVVLLRAAEGSRASRTSRRCSTSTTRPIPARRSRSARRGAHRRADAGRAGRAAARGGRRDRQDPHRGIGRAEQRRAPRRQREEERATCSCPCTFGEITARRRRASPTSRCPSTWRRTRSAASPTRAGNSLHGMRALQFPSSSIGTAAAGIGLPQLACSDEDGAMRFEPLVIDYYGQHYPVARAPDSRRRASTSPSKDIKATLGESVSVGGKTIRTDDAGQMYTYFYKDRDGQPGLPDRFVLRRVLGQDPGVEVRRQDRADRRDRRRRRRDQVTPISARMSPVHDARALGVFDPAGAFLRRADVGRARDARRVPARGALHHRCCCRGSRRARAR